jgi:hypothetical protein
MKKILLFLLICCLYTLGAAAQDNPSFHRNTYIKINPTTLINELDIYIEQEINSKLSLELGISGIYTDYPDYVLAKKIDFGQKKPDISTEQFVDGRGLGFRVGLRVYLVPLNAPLNSARGTYFEPVLFYKKVFYPNENFSFNNINYKESADKNVFGLQFLIGRQFTKDKFILDPFIGVGVRAKIYQYVSYHDDNGTLQVNDGKLTSILPSLHMGIKLGLNLK